MTAGAVMAFEADHGLAVDGLAGPKVSAALATALRNRQKHTRGYSWVYVSTSNPQTLWLWKDGRIVLRSLANTGIAAAPTPAGTWPVYLRYRSQTMEGTTPSGAYYRDPDVPWVSYFYRGDAVHGFPRARYGFPQSLGCVELPVAAAAKVWNNTAIGTLVTVGSGTLAGG
ncbi:MAG: L,D-transpeptidase family protein [Alicyclobacillaceae bacterium]|nr:L,D-transpeptidase family protein [Alicyclobacillaceae bacterium]